MTQVPTRPAKILLLVVLAGLAAAACAQQPRPSAGKTGAAPPPPADTAPSAPSAALRAAPLGTSSVDAAPPPENAQWRKPGVTNAEYRADLESCHAYGQAQVAHDERIESDSGAAFDAFPSGLGFTDLNNRMSQFERRNRRASLYTECMRAKGYRE